MENLKKSIEAMRSNKEHFWAFMNSFWIFMDRLSSDNKLIIIGVCVLALSSTNADVRKYVIGGLIGFMGKSYLDKK